MRINVLQHTPNEGPGAIALWAQQHQHQLYIYHPYQFPKLQEQISHAINPGKTVFSLIFIF
ncbi:hypothetical protein LDI01_28970 [Lentilactobacillus diolivorans]|uniref:Uncharacterized protein n=2 Tax=Lentilactobacillus diolivorans TaxID=179838 RepID=A0A0R1SJD0_9LACO|nr:hypothetical protein FC85_GL001603 [Lentilactobacillus diolivorans DSM 14421]GEP25304.1 hypothetical protein LDI01_28970 [Lentilactobacillus diolivorans]